MREDDQQKDGRWTATLESRRRVKQAPDMCRVGACFSRFADETNPSASAYNDARSAGDSNSGFDQGARQNDTFNKEFRR
jgi:hypothetical protein